MENKDILNSYLSDENVPEEEMSKRQLDIIEAAIKIFSEKGFDGSRTSEIAKEAEVAEGTIFRYYKTKKDLLLGLMIPIITKFFRPLIFMSMEKIMKESESKPFEDVLTDILYDRILLAEKNLPILKTIIYESQYHPELLDPIQKNIAPKMMPIIEDYIKGKIEDNTLRGDLEPRLISRSILSSIIGYLFLSKALPNIFTIEDNHEEMKKISDIILNGIKNRE